MIIVKNDNFYRYETRILSEGKLIKPIEEFRNYDDAIIDNYNKITGLNVSKVIYFLDEIDDDQYFIDNELYKYLYEVTPLSTYFKGLKDFSAHVCMSEKDNIEKIFGKNEGRTWKLFTEYMSKAYGGSKSAIESLDDIFNYRSESNEVEYISENVRVIKLIKSK